MDEIIARIETDKVTVDITSPISGVISKYFAAEGDTVAVGSDFFDIDPDAVAAASSAPATPAPTQAASEPAKVAQQVSISKRCRLLGLRISIPGKLLQPKFNIIILVSLISKDSN
jgi:pyruvate/2-oxoglutarate dehydrogenase complex dihydrolipoamide acyltransferase (E2) component